MNPYLEKPGDTMTLTSNRRILIIDDDVELSSLLVDYLTFEGFSASSAADGTEGLETLGSGDFDLVVLDVMMPGISGVDVLRRIRQTSSIPVLMLTAKGDPVDRIVGLELGADDYVPKPCPPRELVARIHAILRRTHRETLASEPIVVGPVTIDQTQRRVQTNKGEIGLTGTEYALFELLARHAGNPVPKEELYQKALGRPMGPNDRTVDVHVSSIRKKLSSTIGAQLKIESVRGFGYRLTVTDASV